MGVKGKGSCPHDDAMEEGGVDMLVNDSSRRDSTSQANRTDVEPGLTGGAERRERLQMAFWSDRTQRCRQTGQGELSSTRE